MNLIALARDGGIARNTSSRTLGTSEMQSSREESRSRALEDQRQLLADAAGEIAWSGNPERARVAREVLLAGGSLSVPVLLKAIAELPRSDVQEEGASILARLAEEESSFAELRTCTVSPNFLPPARATAARALGAADLSGDMAGLAIRTLAALLADPSAEVRDATVSALSDRGGAEAKQALEGALARETAPFIREAIAQAIEEC
jgi:HEAT repeat protein